MQNDTPSHFFQSLELDGFLSFGPDSGPIGLNSLNVLIGPNGSGKSNFIEAFELLKTTPGKFATAIRDGGGASEWIWKGSPVTKSAKIEAILPPPPNRKVPVRYGLEFQSVNQRLEVTDEYLQDRDVYKSGAKDVFFYYRFQRGNPVINAIQLQNNTLVQSPENWSIRKLKREDLTPDESVLSQRKEPDIYPEIAWAGNKFESIYTFRDWTFGRYTPARKSQETNLPTDFLLPDSSNLALVINELEHFGLKSEFENAVRSFLPSFEKVYTRIYAGYAQLYLHEYGLNLPIPATRLSDGTIRFLSLLVLLFQKKTPSVVCIEEPELGMHPDAMGVIAELLISASKRMQLVVTTHSDALVSALSEQAESVLVCDRLNGCSRLQRVDHEKIQWWLEKYKLGEIWRMGEIGGNP